MKKLIAIILFCAMLLTVTTALADLPDISGLSVNELEQLRQLVCKEIMTKSEWGEVTVPAGFYVVGEDIPAGHWTIRCAQQYAILEYFSKTDETGRNADIFGAYYGVNLGAPGNDLESIYSTPEIDLELKAGYYIIINMGSCVFSPFAGRTSPFFP